MDFLFMIIQVKMIKLSISHYTSSFYDSYNQLDQVFNQFMVGNYLTFGLLFSFSQQNEFIPLYCYLLDSIIVQYNDHFINANFATIN